MDYLSLHYYHNAPEGNMAAFLSASRVFEDFLETEIAACDVVQAMLRDPRKMMIAFDEYGCNFAPQRQVTVGRCGAIDHGIYPEFSAHMERPFRFNDPENPEKPAGKESQMLNTLSLMSVLMMLMRHADRVKIGCMTGGLFNIGYDEERVWKQIGYYPLEMMIRFARGISLNPAVDGPGFDVEGYNLNDFNQTPAYRDIPYIEAAASMDETAGEAAIFIINRNWERDMEVEMDVSGFGDCELIEHVELFAEDLYAANTGDKPDAVVPRINEETELGGGLICGRFKKLSFNMIRLSLKK